jgi:hypothetical protein
MIATDAPPHPTAQDLNATNAGGDPWQPCAGYSCAQPSNDVSPGSVRGGTLACSAHFEYVSTSQMFLQRCGWCSWCSLWFWC